MTTHNPEPTAEQFVSARKLYDRIAHFTTVDTRTDFIAAFLAARDAETIRPWKERVLSLENQYRHAYQASYITQGDEDILTEICNECGRNLRDELHAPESSHPVPNKGESR